MESPAPIELLVPKLAQSIRLDKWLLEDGQSAVAGQDKTTFSRSQIQKLIEGGKMSVNGAPVKKNYKVKSGDKIKIVLPGAKSDSAELVPVDMPLDVLYEDDDIAIINKAPGIAVHRGEGEQTEKAFLVNILLHKFGQEHLSVKGGPERPGIVHRLDKDTSGIMIIAKSDLGWTGIHEMLKERRDIEKQYHCVVLGRLKEKSGEIRSRIARHPKQGHKMITSNDPSVGKEAHTDYTVLKEFQVGPTFYSLVSVVIHTGRTHQIRVHMASIQHPIVGDCLYSAKNARFGLPHLLLVSKDLRFSHPIKTGEKMHFEIEYPEHFRRFLESLELKSANDSKRRAAGGAGNKSRRNNDSSDEDDFELGD